jgi:DeoR family transcriptional regulator of aga operon
MRPEERQKQILEFLRAIQREWSVDELAETFGVTTMTIRRDLSQLYKQGVVIRTHGGCISVIHSGFESVYQKRVASNFALKHAIGKFAARLIQDGQNILILDSSTTYHLATHLDIHRDLTVYTNSIAMITELAKSPSIDVYVVGGKYNRDMMFLGGSLTHSVLEAVQFDSVFISVDAIGPSGKCMVFDHDTARMIRIILEHAKSKTLLTDHTKVDASSKVICCELSDFDTWITTPGMPKERLRKYKSLTEVIEVPL